MADNKNHQTASISKEANTGIYRLYLKGIWWKNL